MKTATIFFALYGTLAILVAWAMWASGKDRAAILWMLETETASFMVGFLRAFARSGRQ